MLRVQRFWRGACCASLLVSCATAPLASPPNDPVATLGDDLIAAGIEAELDKAAISAHRGLLRRDCDAGELLACGALVAQLPAGSERQERLESLIERRDQAGFFVWSTLVYTAPESVRRDLVAEAHKRFPHSDAFISVSNAIPARAEAIESFVNNPTFMTLMQLSLRLAKDDDWALLSEAMTLALSADAVDTARTAEYWILRSRVEHRLKQRELAWAYSAVAAVVRQRGQNKHTFIEVLANQAALSADTLDLLPTLLSLPSAQRIRVSEGVLLDGLRAHRARVQLTARALLAPNPSREQVFGRGLIAALVGTRFETDMRRRRRLLAEAVLQAPDNLQAWVRLAAIEDELKNIPEAIGALRNALRVDSDNPESLNNLAYMLALHRPEDLAEAERLARRSLVIRPSPKTLDTLAEICFRRNRQAAALRFIRLAKRLEPSDSFYARQEARMQAGDPSAPVPAENE